MGLILTDDEAMLVDASRGLLNREAPIAAFRALRDGDEPLAWDRALLAKLAQNGMVAPNVTEADGGIGLGASAAGLIMEQTGRVLAAAPLVSAAMATRLITDAATEEQRSRWLPPLVAGERVIAAALDEASRHDPDMLETSAVNQGDGWKLSGSKTAVIDGFGADAYLVSAACDGAPAIFLVERGASGLTVDRARTIDSRNHARIGLSDTPAIRLGGGDAGTAIAAALDLGRALLAAEMLGISDEAFERTVAYLKERKQFDRLLGSFQALQHRAARLYARLDLAHGVVLKALRAIDAGDADATWLASLSKGVMSSLCRDVLMEAMQMHGGIGVTDDYDIGLFVKRGQVAGELLGDNHFHTERLAAGYWHI